jgi:hypothetical protein
MNYFGANKRVPVDLDEIEQTIRTPIPRQPALVPPVQAEAHTPLQIIAHAITRLTWADAEAMGEAIKSHLTGDIPITAAIQAWARGWEKFEND